MAVLERWRYGDPLEVVISDEQAALRRKKTGQKQRPAFEPCDGCRHLVRAFGEKACDMKKKRFIKCSMYSSEQGRA